MANEILKNGDRVRYRKDAYVVTKVWNHGGSMVYYDLEAEEEVPGTDYRPIQMSVYHSEVEHLRDEKIKT